MSYPLTPATMDSAELPIARGFPVVLPVFRPVPAEAVGTAPLVTVTGNGLTGDRNGAYMDFDIVSKMFNMELQMNHLTTQSINQQNQINNQQNQINHLTTRDINQQNQINHLTRQNVNQQNQIDHLGRQLHVVRRDTSVKCPHCLRQNALLVLFCGHVFCNECVGNMRGNVCPFDHDTNGFVRNPATYSPLKPLSR